MTRDAVTAHSHQLDAKPVVAFASRYRPRWAEEVSMRSRLHWLYFLFGLSGFSGLIYESIWTHYLKLFLGHAAHAQTLVLAIFMGGMATGSWISSRWTDRRRNPLRDYAAIEAAVGLLALAFHTVFVIAIGLAHESIIPRLATAENVTGFKWALSVSLILPQSVLLGMTFPLMSAGVLRAFPDRPGRTIALLYFANSLGAAIGVLASGFVLIGSIGLPGTIRLAGLVNLALAAVVFRLAGGVAPQIPREPIRSAGTTIPGRRPWVRFLLWTSLLTGATSFIYEIVWIRMLSLVLGSSTHAFELMLSAFILGLAFGGLYIHVRIDRLISPVRTLGRVQIGMGVLAVATLVPYGATFDAMRWLVSTLPATGGGYTLFNLASNGIALAIMLPATFCAGMTLPLITLTLLREGVGERSIGAVYGANTVGAILGVAFAVHVGMPGLGVKWLLLLGGGVDVAIGVGLIWAGMGNPADRTDRMAWTVLPAVAIAAAGLVDPDPYRMASGVYRDGKIPSPLDQSILFHEDGKTATVSVLAGRDGSVTIRTNGKPDAHVMLDPGRPAGADESVMVLLGALPLSIRPHSRTAAAIGFGSGLTTEVLLQHPGLESVDTVEIEQKMVDAARHFRPRVDRAFADPRSHVHVDDAKTFFAAHQRSYDLIISEPSNPWVSGVAGLFSTEFYGTVRRHLAPGGMFVQWLQLYEIDEELVASVLKAIDGSFADWAAYAADDWNLIIVAVEDGRVGEPRGDVFSHRNLAASMARVDVRTVNDLKFRRVGTKKSWRGLLDSYAIPANSDYFPVLDQGATRSRFLRRTATPLIDSARSPFCVSCMLDPAFVPDTARITASPFLKSSQKAAASAALLDFLVRGVEPVESARRADPGSLWASARVVVGRQGNCRVDEGERARIVGQVAEALLPFLSPREMQEAWGVIESGPCGKPGEGPASEWEGLLRAIGRHDAERMRIGARQLLETASPPEEPLRFIVLTALAGSVLASRPDEACELWSTWGRGEAWHQGPGIPVRLLAGSCATFTKALGP